MDVLILSGHSIMLLISSMMLRDLSGQKGLRAKKGKCFFGGVAIVSAVTICVAFPWDYWWLGVAWTMALFIFGRLGHYLAT